MIVVLSPAISLDFQSPSSSELYSVPNFLDHADELIARCRELSADDLKDLMGISDKLAQLNVQRFADYEQPLYPAARSKQAALAFAGDTFMGLSAESFSDAEHEWAQAHVRIISGLYGLLRPMDLIQPYRLEMGTRLSTLRGDDLYGFWGSTLAEALSDTLDASPSRTIVNCASKEYFKALATEALDARVVTPVFKDLRKGKYRVISFFAKRARGAMAAFVVKHRVTDPARLRDFDYGGYTYSEVDSSEDQMVFLRSNA